MNPADFAPGCGSGGLKNLFQLVIVQRRNHRRGHNRRDRHACRRQFAHCRQCAVAGDAARGSIVTGRGLASSVVIDSATSRQVAQSRHRGQNIEIAHH